MIPTQYQCANTAECRFKDFTCQYRKPHTHATGRPCFLLCWDGKERIECAEIKTGENHEAIKNQTTIHAPHPAT